MEVGPDSVFNESKNPPFIFADKRWEGVQGIYYEKPKVGHSTCGRLFGDLIGWCLH